MDGVGTPVVERPRLLPGYDTPNPAHNTYTLQMPRAIFGVLLYRPHDKVT